ncbi:MAG: bactofilin family protein [Planctomycetota bacterium]|jgi:hypothetical protein
MAKRKQVTRREILCPRCETPFEVSSKTQSTMCPGCNQICKVGNEKISGYVARQELFTAGDAQITKRGHLVAEVRVYNFTVAGEVKGSVNARESVCIEKTGKLYGDVTTPRLTVKNGAHLVGYCVIGIPIDQEDSESAGARRRERVKA